jgi:phosphoglycolate phosphatase-like HAD superfamily hydrolase
MTPRFPQILGLVFDFDGTLVDASEPICRAFNSALQGFGAATMEPAAIRALIGRPLKEMFPRALPGLSEAEIEQLITDYRAAFTPIATELSQPIPGLQAMLASSPPLACWIGSM